MQATELKEKRLPMVDHGRLEREAIDRAVREVSESLDADAEVYLHCRAGQQRSAAVAAGVMAVRENVDVEKALDEVVRHRPGARPLRRQRRSLLRWWRRRAVESA
jgi:protein-tyrosine phosphatase